MKTEINAICDTIRRRDHARMVRMENFIEEQKIKKALAPIQWELLKKHLEHTRKAMADVSPVQLTIRLAANGHAMTVSNPENGRRVTLSYDPDVPCIHVQGYDGSPYFAFQAVNNGSDVQFFDQMKNIGTMADDIVFDVTHYLTR
jgi:hypothetical protein